MLNLSYQKALEAQQAIEKREIPLGTMSAHITPRMEEVEDEGNSAKKIRELCISSPYLSLGYNGNKEEQQAAFFELDHQRYYRTGDYVEIKQGNIYVFRGRKAWHVKVNGQRICLKEVEDVIKIHFPAMEACLVITDKKEELLYAFYTLKKGESLTQQAGEISKILGSYLQSHEIPVDYFQLTDFPKLANQKIDRIRLKELIDEKKMENTKRSSEKTNLHTVNKTLSDLEVPYTENDEECSFKELGLNSITIYRFLER